MTINPKYQSISPLLQELMTPVDRFIHRMFRSLLLSMAVDCSRNRIYGHRLRDVQRRKKT